MIRSFPRRRAAFALLSGLIAAGGCGEPASEPSKDETSGGGPVATAGPPPESPVSAPEQEEEYHSSPEVIEIMHRLNSEPDSLTPVIGQELKEATPPWATIQEQAAEFKRLAEDLSKYEPQRGTKKSWSEQTATYAKLAADLDEAVRAEKKDEAVAAQQALEVSCTPCHREHRVIRPAASAVGGGGGNGGGRRRRGGTPPEGSVPPGAPVPTSSDSGM